MTTDTATEVRDRILRLAEQRHDYVMIDQAETYLSCVGEDHPVRLRTVQAYLRLGLFDPARAHVETATAFVDSPPGMSQIRRDLATLPTSRVPWTDRGDRFESNLGALSERGVDVACVRDRWQRGAALVELHRDVNGVRHVLRHETPGGPWRWIPFFADHRAVEAQRPLPDDVRQQQPGPYALEGLGIGSYLQRIFDATQDSFLGYSCPLYVLEPDLLVLAVALHLRDWSSLLAHPRVYAFIGPDGVERFQEFLQDAHALAIPNRIIHLCEPARVRESRLADIIQEAATRREDALAESLAALEAQYAGRGTSHWADRFRSALAHTGKPLHILSAVSRHTTFLQHSLRDAKRAFESLGHACTVLTESNDHECVSPMAYHEAMRKFDPDLFFVPDHIRPEYADLVPGNLPVMTWDQDQLPHVFTAQNVAGIAPIDFLTGCAVEQCTRLGADPRQLLPSVIPTCPHQFSGPPLTEEERDRYACDVSYVSHASQTPKAFHEEERGRHRQDSVIRLLDALFELLPQYLTPDRVPHGRLLRRVLARGLQETGVSPVSPDLEHRLVNWYLWRLADRMFRHDALQWAADWARARNASLRLYGNGWDRHPTLAPFAAGPANNGRELICIYRASKINLQLMPAGFIHQRALDGLASGGFFLCRTAHGDQVGPALGKLGAFVRDNDIRTDRALLSCTDADVQRWLDEFLEEDKDELTRTTGDADDLIVNIRAHADLPTPHSCFPGFGRIVFDSPESFAATADRFAADDHRRRAVADEMRDVVLRDFTYESTMKRFLESFATYLGNVSGQASSHADRHLRGSV